MNLKLIIKTTALFFAISSFASAALLAIFTQQATNGNPHIGTITATSGDLLETQGSVVGSAQTKTGGGAVSLLTSGTIQTDGTTLFKGGTGGGSDPAGFVEYNLDITTNTDGYDITSIKTISSWTDRRSGQAWTVQVSLVGSGTFTDLFTLLPADGESSGNGVSQVILSDGGLVFATGVDAIRFNFANVKNGGGTLNWGAYRELDVIGAATVVPEPSSVLLVGLGALFLLRRRR